MEVSGKVVESFHASGRDFAWRSTEDPYKVFLAEMLLQKTRVESVEEVYRKLLKKYPTVEDLSKANKDELSEILEPLGLHNIRAERLINSAEMICRDHGEEFPKEKEELDQLPGVGDYIANGVLCLAFNREVPMVDSNVGRVVGRVFEGEKDDTFKKEDSWRRVENMVSKNDARAVNLGLIDIGAMICTPRNPECEECPLKKECRYYAEERGSGSS